jgi:hypothetical protein
MSPSAGADQEDMPTAAVPKTVRLDEPARGRAAVRALGDDLGVAAATNGMASTELRDLLLSDPTAWVDDHGRVFFVEPPAESDAGDLPVHALIDAADAFTLHSKPGSQRVLFLDFDGHLVSGTAWNDSDGVTATTHPAWTLDGDSTTFSTAERNAVISIWARVAEDYAPFDVDVTTLDPGQAAITRTNSGDLAFGTRVLVSPSTDAASHICPSGCGGVAYLDVFDLTVNHDYFQPAWVFPQSLSNSSKAVAEAASHEAGHNFSLSHDGGTGVGYYGGHAMWAPIMGVGYGKPLVQWSKGDYPGATQTQDDVARISSSGAPYRTDEAGDTVGSASPLSAATAYVTTRTDTDVWSLGSCAGAFTVSASPAAVSPNLDIELTLLSAAGSTVASANPVSATSTSDVATGISASISTSVATGAYYVRVDGVGNGTFDPATGYDDYASVGAYTLGSTGCGGGPVDPIAPGLPTSLGVAPAGNGQSATFSWAAPFADGGSPVTGYVVQRSGGTAQNVGAGATSLSFSGLTPGASYTFTVAAKNTVGTGASASTSAVMPIPATVPSAPQELSVALGPGETDATVAWDPPVSDGGSPLLDYELLVDASSPKPNALSTGLLLTGLTPGHTYDVQVRARNAVGYGPAATATLAVPLPPPTAPSAPRIGAATSGRKGGVANARVAWSPPSSTGGAAVASYLVYAYRVRGGLQIATVASPNLAAATRSVRMRLPKGKYQFAVKAWNGVGWSALSARSRIVRAR